MKVDICISFRKIAKSAVKLHLTRGMKFPFEKLPTYLEPKHFEKVHFPLLSSRIYTRGSTRANRV